MNAIEKPVKPHLFIFDKDGCLVRSVVEPKSGKSHAPNRLDDQQYFDDVKPTCERLLAEGHTLAIASNQGGVAFGIFTADVATELVKAAADHIGAKAYQVSFFHPKGRVAPWNREDDSRKPGPGMLIGLMNALGFAPEDTTMVGDWETDKQAADAAGCGFEYAHVFFGRVNPFADRLHAALGMPS